MKRILSFDLELNQDPATGPRIIEVGACIGNLDTGAIEETYTKFVNPGQPLQEVIIKLTSITQADVDAGCSLDDAYVGMVHLAKRYSCLTLPLVWGGGDGLAIRQELKSAKWKFGRRELDVKALFQAYQLAKGVSVKSGLESAMNQLDMQFVGKVHRAIDDAANTFHIFYKLISFYK
jgi:inhibitor of KinA sporulation pathway (predicted exonuclease)